MLNWVDGAGIDMAKHSFGGSLWLQIARRGRPDVTPAPHSSGNPPLQTNGGKWSIIHCFSTPPPPSLQGFTTGRALKGFLSWTCLESGRMCRQHSSYQFSQEENNYLYLRHGMPNIGWAVVSKPNHNICHCMLLLKMHLIDSIELCALNIITLV